MKISHRSMGSLALGKLSRKSRMIIAAAGVSMVAGSLNAQIPWTNPAGGTFQVASNWAGGVVPDLTQYAGFVNDQIGTGTVYFTGSVSTFGLSMNNTTGTITFDIGAGNKWTMGQYTIMGDASAPAGQTPSFILTSGEMEAALILIGNDLKATGHVTVTGPNSILRARGTGGSIRVGSLDGPNGSMEVRDGGQAIAENFWVGLQRAVNTSLLVTDPGSKVTVNSTIQVAGGNEGATQGGNDRIDVVNGGEIAAGRILMGVGNTTPSPNNHVRVSGAGSKITLTGNNATNSTAASVGFRYGGNDFLVENDGQVITTAGDFRIGAGTFVDGGDLLRITGGTITMMGNGDLDPMIQGPEKGRLNITNGTFRMEGGVSTFPAILANASTAVVDLRGGTANVKNALINNGTTLFVGDGTGATATYRMSDVTGTHNFSNGMEIRTDGRLEGAGIINGDVVNNGAIAPGTSAGTTKIVGNLTVNTAGGATVDLANNGLVIDWTGANPVATIAGYIANARNTGGSGLWTGSGITSSLAVGNSGVAVGYADNGSAGFMLTSFLGQTVDDTSVLVRATRNGDANLDGITNIGDFSLLAANFNQPGVWSGGDFNYDGTTNIGDFSLLASNFNQGFPASRAAVPEPASLTLAGASLAMLRRRR